MRIGQPKAMRHRTVFWIAIAVALRESPDAFADDGSKIELPVVGVFDWVKWAEGEAMRHFPTSRPADASALPATATAPPPGTASSALSNPNPISPSSDSSNPISVAPTFNLRGLHDPRFGGKLDARILDGTGVSFNELEEPVARRREMKIGFYQGPLKLEAAKSVQNQSATTSVGTQF